MHCEIALATGETVASANPLGNALSLLIGSAADVLIARLQAIIALVFELCLVGLMVSYEALGHKSEPEPARVVLPPRPKPQLIASNPSRPVGSVKRILTDNLERCPEGKVEIAEVGNRYRNVCKAEGKCAVSQDAFIAEIEAFCELHRHQTEGHRRRPLSYERATYPSFGTAQISQHHGEEFDFAPDLPLVSASCGTNA